MNILYLEGVSGEKDRNRILEVVAHELSHQWFGNLVTMHWWTDLWLNEGKKKKRTEYRAVQFKRLSPYKLGAVAELI